MRVGLFYVNGRPAVSQVIHRVVDGISYNLIKGFDSNVIVIPNV